MKTNELILKFEDKEEVFNFDDKIDEYQRNCLINNKIYDLKDQKLAKDFYTLIVYMFF